MQRFFGVNNGVTLVKPFFFGLFTIKCYFILDPSIGYKIEWFLIFTKLCPPLNTLLNCIGSLVCVSPCNTFQTNLHSLPNLNGIVLQGPLLNLNGIELRGPLLNLNGIVLQGPLLNLNVIVLRGLLLNLNVIVLRVHY